MLNSVMMVLVLVGVVLFVSKRKHLLMTLMSMEFLSLMLFFGLLGMSMQGVCDGYYMVYYMVMSACEGALGLSIIVLMVKGKGSDLVGGVSMMQC